jgi:hypothetical protein
MVHCLTLRIAKNARCRAALAIFPTPEAPFEPGACAPGFLLLDGGCLHGSVGGMRYGKLVCQS